MTLAASTRRWIGADRRPAITKASARATAKLNEIVEEARSQRSSAHLIEKLYEIKTGEAITSVKLDELPTEWARIQRKREPNARYASQCQSTLKRFALFVQGQNSKADEIAHVTRTAARAFMDEENRRGVTAKTWNDTLKLLRATFKYLLPAGAINPFSDTPTKETETVFRKPFSPEELKAILEAAHGDDFIRPILATGICTAMRRGDCCLLQWKDVDMDRRFITVKTAKTGVTVSIPIFPMLYDELAALRQGVGEYVFPEQATMYLENPDGITWRVKKILATALGESAGEDDEEGDGEELDEAQPKELALPQFSAEETTSRVLKYISTVDDEAKRGRMASVYHAYMGGKRVCLVADSLGVSKGSVSNYLHEIEQGAGCLVIRDHSGSMTARLKDDSSLLRSERKTGQRRASVRDFHSFRVTWVTLALTAGVPLELVQKVTGHKTTDIVLKHYFQPGKEAFRQALQSAMPKLLTNGQKSPKDEMREIIETMTAKTLKIDKARLLALL